MKLNCIIIDDESNNIENLRHLLHKCCSDIFVIATATNTDDAIRNIKEHQPDLIFLDIQMPGKSGFEVLKAFPEIFFEVIFITAYDKYGIQAIKFSALDYILKPVEIEELKLAVEKAKSRIEQKNQNQKIDNLLHYIKRGQYDSPKIALPTLDEIMYIKTDEIVRCAADSNYTTFYLQNGEKILVCKSLKEYSEILIPYKFVRCHQSHLVNLKFIRSYLREDGGKLLLHDATKIPISRQNKNKVKEILNSTF